MTLKKIKRQKLKNKNLKKKNVLIVGGTGQIGEVLKKSLKKSSYRVSATTRHREIKKKDLLYLDLEKPNFEIDFTKFDFVIICAAITNIAKCETQYLKCKKINYKNTITLINKCVKSKCFTIFISSNAVFDGRKKFYKSADARNPVSKYGEFKLLVEKYIEDLPSNKACVLRLTKVITNKTTLIQNWKKNLKNGKIIKVFNNKFISPVKIKDLNAAIQKIIENKKSGIFQLGGKKEISYYEYAKKIFSSDPNMKKNIIPLESSKQKIYTLHNSLMTNIPQKNKKY